MRLPRLILMVVVSTVTAWPLVTSATIYWTPAHELAPQEWSCQMTAGDLDGDGDIDISMLRDTPHHFWNVGTAALPSWELDITQYGDIPSCVGRDGDLGDLDGDGDLDLVVTCFYDFYVRFYWNIGASGVPVWMPDHAVFDGVPNYDGPYHPRFADMDSDGDLDFLLGDSLGRVMYSENVGSFNSPEFNYVGLIEGIGFGSGGAFTFAVGDIDVDGDLDLVRVSYYTQPECFENIGTPSSFAFAQSNDLLEGVELAPSSTRKGIELADLDGDGDPDLLIAVSTPGNFLFLNQGESNSAVKHKTWGMIKATYRTPE